MVKRFSKTILGLLVCGLFLLYAACSNDKASWDKGHEVYTCPMHPEVISDKPGICPKCKMDLEKKENPETADAEMYTCPMHPEIIRDKPGPCPICGMDLVKQENASHEISDVDLSTLIQPTNSTVISSIPVTTIQRRIEKMDKEALGSVEYDTRSFKTVSARVGGRIEKLYVKYRFQHVKAGDKLMDMYSPELSTGQQNLLFLLRNDPDNATLIHAAKQKLLLLGMTQSQIDKVASTGKALFSVTVYSNTSGHLHEAQNEGSGSAAMDMRSMTNELTLKEGMYVTAGQPVFRVYNQNNSWITLNLFARDNSVIKVGTPVTIIPETAPEKKFQAKISFIEPFYRNNSKTLTARVYFNNAALSLPIGSQVKAQMHIETLDNDWLPQEAVLSLGMQKAVLLKKGGSFSVRTVSTGIASDQWIQVISGLDPTDSVATNAQFLIDSESFIKVN